MEPEELVCDHILATADGEGNVNIIDITAPSGYEADEVTAAKDLVYDVLWDNLDVTEGTGNILFVADRVVDALIAEGWRPTEREEN